MEAIVDDIAAVLNAANVQAILMQYYPQGKGDDPILHFYETFLAEYDPETRERRGVYYTPQPVVRYIVRAVHDLLKTRFDLPDGLADKRVTLLDPAAGTLTFPAEAIQSGVSGVHRPSTARGQRTTAPVATISCRTSTPSSCSWLRMPLAISKSAFCWKPWESH
jgi:hypothetical protein